MFAGVSPSGDGEQWSAHASWQHGMQDFQATLQDDELDNIHESASTPLSSSRSPVNPIREFASLRSTASPSSSLKHHLAGENNFLKLAARTVSTFGI